MYDLLCLSVCLFFFLDGGVLEFPRKKTSQQWVNFTPIAVMESDALVTLTHDDGFCEIVVSWSLGVADRTGFWFRDKKVSTGESEYIVETLPRIKPSLTSS